MSDTSVYVPKQTNRPGRAEPVHLLTEQECIVYHTHKTREAQAWRKARIDPSRAERQTLEAIAQRGGLVIAYRNGARTTSLADGTPVSRLGSLNLNLAIELGWLQPDPQSHALLPGLPPQRYLANERFVVEESQA